MHPLFLSLVLKGQTKNSLVTHTRTDLDLGSHGDTIQGIDVGLAAGAAEEQLGKWRLLVLWEVREEELKKLRGKVEDLDSGAGDDRTVAGHLAKEGGLHLEYLGGVWEGGREGER